MGKISLTGGFLALKCVLKQKCEVGIKAPETDVADAGKEKQNKRKKSLNFDYYTVKWQLQMSESVLRKILSDGHLLVQENSG